MWRNNIYVTLNSNSSVDADVHRSCTCESLRIFQSTKSSLFCDPGWEYVRYHVVSLKPISRSSSSHISCSFDWAIISIVICDLLAQLRTVDVQVDSDCGFSKHISNTPWSAFGMKVFNRKPGNLIIWYTLVVEGIREPDHDLRMYIYAEYTDNLSNPWWSIRTYTMLHILIQLGETPTIFILTSPEAVACEPGERDHINVPIPVILGSNAHIVDLLQPSMQTSPKNAAVVPKRWTRHTRGIS